MTLDELLMAIVTLVALALAAALRPDRATAPDGWFVNGVRPSGEFEILRAPPPEKPCALGVNSCSDSRPSYGLGSRIYCTGGSRPIVVDFRTVGCQR